MSAIPELVGIRAEFKKFSALTEKKLGPRLERLRRSTKGSKVAAFNTSKFRIKGLQMTMAEVGL